jgi:TolA-binding protein
MLLAVYSPSQKLEVSMSKSMSTLLVKSPLAALFSVSEILAISCVCFVIFTSLSFAQDTGDAQNTSAANTELSESENQRSPTSTEAPAQQDVETISIEGRAGDAALQAFSSGNFELAEIKFKDNVRCALRAERAREAFATDMRNSQLTQSLTGDITANTPNIGVNSSSAMASSKSGQDQGPLRTLTCDNRGYQVYMVGMSQLQQGKSEDAEASFESAIRLNKHLHDAMYRLALMKLLRNDEEGAQEHFEDMQRLLKRCKNCDSKDNIQTRLDFLAKALDGKVRRE